jgi:hypothetical protein
MMTSQAVQRLRLAELSSAVGAGVLGVGIGALLASPLRSFAIPILVAGLLLHAWGMADKHRLDTDGDATQPWWSTALYWICWAALGALVIAIVMRRIG